MLANVGKAYSGLTDEEIDALTRRLEKLTIERFGGVRVVRPEIVLEVAFDGVQPSKRHKSGYALRFPRIVRIREDKTPDQADAVETVAALFRAQVESGHREDGAEPAPPAKGQSRRSGKKREPKVAAGQLGLFDEDKTPKGR